MGQEEEPEHVSTNDVSKEGKISEKPQQASQDTEVRTVDSTDIETLGADLSQKEKTPRRSDQGKGIAKLTPSSSKRKSLLEHIPRWLRKEVIRNKKKQFNIEEEDIMELITVLRRPESPPKDARTLSFIMSDQSQDLFSHVAIPPLHSNIEELDPWDYQIREVMLGKPTLVTAKLMVTIAIKEVFKSLEQEGEKLITLW